MGMPIAQSGRACAPWRTTSRLPAAPFGRRGAPISVPVGVETLAVPHVEALLDALALALPGGGAQAVAASTALTAPPRVPAARSRIMNLMRP